jgi:DNA-binding transcriptional regulator YiaG
MHVRFTVRWNRRSCRKIWISRPTARIAEVEALLDRPSSIDPQLRTIVEMRVFEGFSIPDIAARLNSSARTVDRRWAFVCKWLEYQPVPART